MTEHTNRSGATAPRTHKGSKTRQTGRAIVRQFILIVFLVTLWVFLWDTITITHIITGTVVALLVTRLFYLPPIDLPARINVFHSAYLVGWFTVSLIVAAAQVAWVAIRPKTVSPGSIFAVDVHTRSDLLLTLVAHISGLIPGTFVVEVDRSHSVLYLHALNCNTEARLEKQRKQAHRIETLLIKAMGSPHDIAVLNESRVQAGLKPILAGHSLDSLRARRKAGH